MLMAHFHTKFFILTYKNASQDDHEILKSLYENRTLVCLKSLNPDITKFVYFMSFKLRFYVIY